MDKNVQSVIEKLKQRAEAGLQKYGVTTERTDIDLLGWLKHLQEELFDASVYAERLICEERDRNRLMAAVAIPAHDSERPLMAARLANAELVNALERACLERDEAIERKNNQAAIAKAVWANHEKEFAEQVAIITELHRQIDELKASQIPFVHSQN